MPLVLLDQLRYVVLILNKLACFIEGELLKGLDLGVTERDTLGGEELAQHVVADLACAIWVHDAESSEQMLCRCRFEFINHEYIDHERLDLLLLDELGGLIVLELDDNIVTNLRLGWELKQVSHQVGNLTLVQETTSVDIDNAEGFSHLLAVKVFLPLLLNRILWLRQHFLSI